MERVGTRGQTAAPKPMRRAAWRKGGRHAGTAERTGLWAGRETALATAAGPWVSARGRHLPVPGDGGAGYGSRETAARRGAKRDWPRHDRGCFHDDHPEFAARTGWFGLSLSAGRLGHLFAVES